MLLDKMRRLGIREEDLEEKFIRSGGKGGQNVNKKSTCVFLKHKPTGLTVKCQNERYQRVNRFLARRILVDKIENIRLKKESELQKKITRIRRQKKKRSKRAREKILKAKKARSEKKKSRSFIKHLSSEEMS
ncbi:MAG: peptide chain release factor-like protein [Spirochaetes bacterium]|nr:peptide chain release factor-like protein [Spirochaetota bacterium]